VPILRNFRICNFDTDIGTEELAHLEMVATIVHQLTKNLSMEQIEESGFRNYYVDHTIGIWPQAAGGIPFNACEFQSKGDIITDLMEDMAAEQKARSTYDNILRLVRDEPDVYEPIKFLRAREVVHFQRFGEANREDCSKFGTHKIQSLRRIPTRTSKLWTSAFAQKKRTSYYASI
jgi:spore coat protein JC